MVATGAGLIFWTRPYMSDVGAGVNENARPSLRTITRARNRCGNVDKVNDTSRIVKNVCFFLFCFEGQILFNSTEDVERESPDTLRHNGAR